MYFVCSLQKIRKTLPLMTAVIFLKMLSGLNTEANPIPQNMLHILATLSIGVIRCSSTCDGQLKTHIQHVVESTLESAIETFPTIIFEMTEVLISEMKGNGTIHTLIINWVTQEQSTQCISPFERFSYYCLYTLGLNM